MDRVERTGTRRDPTIDVLRGITIAAVTAYHFHADVRGVALTPDLARVFAAALAAHDARGALGVVAITCVAAPWYRLDLFLFVTGFVLALSSRRPVVDFWKRRARDVLPNYWLGSALVALALVSLAALRAAALDAPLADEIREGTRLARAPYLFSALDLLRSLSLVGRFQDARSFQVVAPSMWYVMLLLQLYVIFPVLRAFRDRAGAAVLFAVVLVFTWLARWLVFRFDPLPSFGPNPTVLYFIPFRLAPVALGMVASDLMARAWREPPRLWVYAGTVPALVWMTVTVWLAVGANRPGTLAGVIGPVVPLALGVPALLWLATAARVTPILGAALCWVGRHSLSILVVQDVLRLIVGTALRLDAPLDRWFWRLFLPYLALCVALARLWDPVAVRFRDRLWPRPPDAHLPGPLE